MIYRNYDTIEKAVKAELFEEAINKVDVVKIFFLWCLVLAFYALWTQNYCEMLALDSLVREQEMVNNLMFKVLWF